MYSNIIQKYMKNFGMDLMASNVAEEMEAYFGVGSEDITKGFFGGVCKVITQMRYYQEEGTHIQFRLAIGIDKGQAALPRLYRLQKQVISSQDVCGVSREVYSVIKKVLPCCKDNNDVYIILNPDKKEVSAGIYFLELNMLDAITYNFLDAGFIIAECVEENLIQMHLKVAEQHTVSFIKFDLEQLEDANKGLLANDCKNDSLAVRYWKGVFEQVKRCCHGTICLVVDKDFDLMDLEIQKLFIKPPKEIEDITIIPNYFGENGSMESDHSLQIFMSMLDYDGVTIIDTLGRIRSYNNICNNQVGAEGTKNSSNNSQGIHSGSRHVAYECMKKWSCKNLVGIYFQSQEGEIHFYNYLNGKEKSYFDGKIMSSISKPVFDKMSDKYSRFKKIGIPLVNMTQPEKTDYINFNSAVQNLGSAHTGIDNFYREKDMAVKLKWYFEQIDWKRIIDTAYTNDERYRYLRKETLDVVFACIVGNGYGCANSAQETLQDILGAIPNEWIINYFREEYYLDLFVLQDLRFEKPNKRWKEVVQKLLENKLGMLGSNEIWEEIKQAFSYNTSDFLTFYMCMSEFAQGADLSDYEKFIENM